MKRAINSDAKPTGIMLGIEEAHMTSKNKGKSKLRVIKERPAQPYVAGVEVQTQAVIEVQIRVAGTEAEQLTALAERRGISTAHLIQSAVHDFLHEANVDSADWQALGLKAFEAGWDNAEDAVYDNWREAYGPSPAVTWC